jgi:hypothetical protein
LKTTIADMVTYLSASSVPAGGNGSADPEFFNPSIHDYHLAGASPLAGLALSTAFAWDLEGAVRTVPWSVGVYEKDLQAMTSRPAAQRTEKKFAFIAAFT